MTPRVGLVYPARNADRVRALLPSLAGADVRLWALDEPASSLTPWTRGCGPGTRFQLLNRLLPEPAGQDWTVLCDDDVSFIRGDLSRLLDVAARAGFDVAQPAHGPGSHVSQPITRARRMSVAREVWYVEQGPLVAFSPGVAADVLPLREDVGMGWGIEYAWSSLRRRGRRLGIVDAVRIRHLDPPGTAYDVEVAREGGRRLRAEHGFASAEQIKRVVAVWRPWQRRPPWWREGGLPGAGRRAGWRGPR
jgi:hypothetical protein